jgi:hypothetical protein
MTAPVSGLRSFWRSSASVRVCKEGMAKVKLRVCKSAVHQRTLSGVDVTLALPPCPMLYLCKNARPTRACCTLLFASFPGSLSSSKRISRTSVTLGPRNSSTKHSCVPFGPSIGKWSSSCIKWREPVSLELSSARVRRISSSRFFPYFSATEIFSATYS